MTDQAVITSTDALLAAVARLSDDELLLLDRLAWRVANESGGESGRPQIAMVIRHCGVVLAEEQDRRRVLTERAREQTDDSGDGPSTD